MRHFGHGIGHLQNDETQHEGEDASDDPANHHDDSESDAVAHQQENAQEDNIAVDVEEDLESVQSQGESKSDSDGGSDSEMDVDGYNDRWAEVVGNSNNGELDSDEELDAGYTSF